MAALVAEPGASRGWPFAPISCMVDRFRRRKARPVTRLTCWQPRAGGESGAIK